MARLQRHPRAAGSKWKPRSERSTSWYDKADDQAADPMEDLISAFVGARMGQMQLAVAGKMLRMNADNAEAVVAMIDAAQANLDRLANVAAGIGTQVDLSV
ncbi:MAG: hypothetical protein IT537_03905 [Hyphomicrobiales bacterium]|nr:hypothetical protein [Hyphomicrobiales bacterium]